MKANMAVSRATTVVHIIGTLNRGGAETVALDLVRSIHSDVVKQVFICVGSETGTLVDRFESAGADVYWMPIGQQSLVKFSWRLGKLIREIGPEVVQSHLSLTSGVFLALAKLAGVPRRVARLHSEGDGRRGTIGRLVQRELMRVLVGVFATDVVGVTGSSLKFASPTTALAKLFNVLGPSPRRRILPNGVDTSRFSLSPLQKKASPPVVLHVGRNAPEKNRRIIPEIHRAMQSEGAVRTWLVGPGGTGDLEQDVPNGLIAKGESDDVPDMLRRASVLLLPSIREGLPGVILEALSSGVPVVASDLPTLREVQERVEGLKLVPLDAAPMDWARELWNAILAPMDPKTIRAALARSEYDLEKNSAAWELLWQGGDLL